MSLKENKHTYNRVNKQYMTLSTLETLEKGHKSKRGMLKFGTHIKEQKGMQRKY